MKRSYFGNNSAAKDPQAISIARWSPRWWGPGRRYSALAPPADLIKRSKEGLPWEIYVTEYKTKILDKLDPIKIYEDLGDSILLCWERDADHCHRRLVAAWIENALGIEVPEL